MNRPVHSNVIQFIFLCFTAAVSSLLEKELIQPSVLKNSNFTLHTLFHSTQTLSLHCLNSCYDHPCADSMYSSNTWTLCQHETTAVIKSCNVKCSLGFLYVCIFIPQCHYVCFTLGLMQTWLFCFPPSNVKRHKDATVLKEAKTTWRDIKLRWNWACYIEKASVPVLSKAQFSLNPPLYLMLCILGASQASN